MKEVWRLTHRPHTKYEENILYSDLWIALEDMRNMWSGRSIIFELFDVGTGMYGKILDEGEVLFNLERMEIKA